MKTLQQLDSFTRAYIQTALWSSNDDSGEPMDRTYSLADFAPEALEKIVADCEAFQSQQSETIAAASETGEVKTGADYFAHDLAAHDFWLTRNGHGAGFWDGDWPEPFAKTLTDAAHGFGSCDLIIGDDGRLYVYPA